MRESLAHVLVVTRLTLREARRRQLLWIGVVLGLGFVGLFAFGFSAAYRDMLRQESYRAMRNLALEQASNGFMIAGLYVVNFLLVMVTALTAVGSVSAEISSNTIHALAAKPVRRWEILIGKWVGNALMMALYVLLMVGGVMAAVYIISGFAPPNPLAGIALMLLEGLVMLSVATLGSCVLSTLANGVLVFMLYGVAFVGSWVETFGSFMGSQTAVDLGIASSLLMPSEALWRRAQYLMQTALMRNMEISPFSGVSVPSPAFVEYSVLYMLAMLGAAIWVFSRRDF